MTKHAASSAAAVRAAILDPRPFAGPRDGQGTRTRVQLLYGGGMLGHDAVTDLRARLQPLLGAPGLRDRTHAALTAAFEEATVGRISTLERMLASEALRNSLPTPTLALVRDVGGVLVFHLAELGCELASARLAAELLSTAAAQVRAAQLDRAFLVVRHALLRAEDAQATFRDVPYVPGPSYPRLESFDVEAAAWVQAWTTFGSALRMVEDEDTILRGGAGQRVEPPVVQDGDLALDLPDVPPGQLSAEEILAVANARRILDEGARRRAARPALSLVVFPVMTHLPEPSKSIRDRGDSPRALAEPWAGKPMPLVSAPDPAAFVKRLRARFPWAVEAVEAYAADLVGAPYARFSPRILVGPAGCGKTAFARAVLEAAGLDVTVYAGAGQMDGGSWAGTSRMWGSWRPSVPAQACLRFGKASHGIVVDEVEKAGDSRRWGRLDETLLPFLERGSTARAIHDPAFECALDLSPVSYVLTANSLDGLSAPLRDRCQALEWKAPRAEDLPVVAAAILDELRRERGFDEAWCPALDGGELDVLSAWRGGSLRPLRRMIEAVVASRELFARRLPN
ncbi:MULTISPECIES: AAA family ATPase [Methylobacteriaceae]|uniref:ATPase AAA-type core domain-containing protein n=2 Tax=Methylobacterium TaxID=407 RepID=A0A512J1H5_9HYPH|nr:MULTISPECIES: AAA family ATPase [Methylobacterium]MBY0295107.1 AAA family ATPase [Methylobacterium sp.]MDN3621788.1 AAA family ATPase [Methylobacterium isbiliense]GEP03816.1 hypothetical protein MOX02_18540 [Methylobacterium oxalidis]GJD98976.1 Lon protease [Methylobacterium isbiliense]GJE33131.1 Lon protease [Methylobacterium oxalidis]